MATLYDVPEIYEERFSEWAEQAYREHYQRTLEGLPIREILDCSIGSGCLTFCLCGLGYQVWGSDLSRPMLDRAAEKAREKGLDVPLVQCDFRELTKAFDQQFDCVMSTGNALAHVGGADLERTLEQMDALVKPGGYLYFDSRDWEAELKGKCRFQPFGRPFLREDGVRINYVQMWDYHDDGSITINILHAYEREGEIFRQEVYEEHLYPFTVGDVKQVLERLGYQKITLPPFPGHNWYCLLAQKG